MIQVHNIPILVPLGVGVFAIICTIMIHVLPVTATVNLVRREKRLGRVGTPWSDLGIFVRIVLYALLAHLLEIALWGMLFIICGEFRDFGTAFYHSAVNYTSLGYGDLIMTPSLEIARTTRDGRWDAPVRSFDRNDLCGRSTVNSGLDVKDRAIWKVKKRYRAELRA